MGTCQLCPAVQCKHAGRVEFPAFSGISQWWSFEGWTNDPLTWLQSWWTSSNTQIWAAVCITSLKEASRLTQMATDASSCLSCGRWRISCAASWGKSFFQIQRRFLDGFQQWQLHFLNSTWDCRRLVTPLPNCFWSLCHLGPFLKTNKTDIEKIPRVLFFLATHHDVYCFKKSMKKRGKVYSQSGYCSLYKCYWIML